MRPLRVSLAGGGTDLPWYADRFGGNIVGFAINRYVGVTIHPHSFNGGIRAALDSWDMPTDANDLANPFARAVLIRAGINRNIELSSFGDVPGGTGLGSSAAFTVALWHGLAASGGEKLDRRSIAEAAATVEMVDLARPVGKQDHYTSALGGVCVLHFGAGGGVDARKLPVSSALESYIAERMLLFYTGVTRDAGAILAAQQPGAAGEDVQVIEILHAIKALAAEMETAIRRESFDDIGQILHAHWQQKRRLSERVSTPAIDSLYAQARAAGAQGGKILGAGGGGFLLLAVEDGRQERLRAAMSLAGSRELRFCLDHHGSCTARIGTQVPDEALTAGTMR